MVVMAVHKYQVVLKLQLGAEQELLLQGDLVSAVTEVVQAATDLAAAEAAATMAAAAVLALQAALGVVAAVRHLFQVMQELLL